MNQRLHIGLPALVALSLGCGAGQIAGTVDPRQLTEGSGGAPEPSPSAFARQLAAQFSDDPCAAQRALAERSAVFDGLVESTLSELAVIAGALCAAGVESVSLEIDETGELHTDYSGEGAIVADDQILVLDEFEGVEAPVSEVAELPYPACDGYFGAEFDFELVATEAIPITMEITNPEAVILVVSPNGSETCSTQSSSGGAMVNLPPAAGTHEIWIGSHDTSRKAFTLELASGASSGSLWVWRDGTSTSFPFSVVNPQRSAWELSPSCGGFLMGEPTLRVWVPEGRYDAVMATSDGDAVIFAQGPNGAIQCNDDYSGLDPGLDTYFEPGEWTFWVGAYSAGTTLSGTITFQ